MVVDHDNTVFYIERPADANGEAFKRFATVHFEPGTDTKHLASFPKAIRRGRNPVEILEPITGACFVQAIVTRVTAWGVGLS